MEASLDEFIHSWVSEKSRSAVCILLLRKSYPWMEQWQWQMFIHYYFKKYVYLRMRESRKCSYFQSTLKQYSNVCKSSKNDTMTEIQRKDFVIFTWSYLWIQWCCCSTPESDSLICNKNIHFILLTKIRCWGFNGDGIKLIREDN